jgi:hypothetical protein
MYASHIFMMKNQNIVGNAIDALMGSIIIASG